MTVISDEERSKVYAKVVRRFAPLLFICFLVSILDRVNISYAKLQMSTDIGLSDAAYAFGASIFFWGYTIFEVPSNMLLHTVGAKFWISRIMVSWGIVSGLIAFIVPLASLFNVSAETIFYILRMLLGICEAGFFPGVILFIRA
ncbi:MAG: MFS transporter [Planctomycetaceae bacterium]|jgi:MFS family permease|nr:MFS transporter [Planctomycetaceae bacterium]